MAAETPQFPTHQDPASAGFFLRYLNSKITAEIVDQIAQRDSLPIPPAYARICRGTDARSASKEFGAHTEQSYLADHSSRKIIHVLMS
jgi:hypothetical protein